MELMYRVRERQESMIPELEALEKSGAFSPDELKSIIKKRTDFEFLVNQIQHKKIDFLRYLEYEMNLEELRKLRRKKQYSEREISRDEFAKDLDQHYSSRRIHSIFRRATKSYPTDLDLKTDWINYSKKIGSSSLLGRLFASFLAIHSTWIDLWVMAANWEWENRLDITAARNLFQLSVRINPLATRLWLEFFELELKYIKGFTVSTKVNDEIEGIELDEVKTDTKMTDEEKLFKENLINNEILKGQIPFIIYEFAIQRIPKDANFRGKFLEISYKYKNDTLKDRIVSDLLREFSDKKEASSVIANTEYNFLTETTDKLTRIQTVVKKFEDFISSRATQNENENQNNQEVSNENNSDNDNVEEEEKGEEEKGSDSENNNNNKRNNSNSNSDNMDSNKKGKKRKVSYEEIPIQMSIALVTFLRDRLSEPNDKSTENYIHTMLTKIFEETLIYDVNLEFALLWVDTLSLIGKYSEAREIASKLTDNIFADSARLWETRIRLEIKVTSLQAITSPLAKEDTKRIKGMFVSAFSKIDKISRLPLYILFMHYKVISKPLKNVKAIITKLFEKISLSSLDDKSPDVANFKQQFLEWAFLVGGLECSRLVYQQCLTGSFSSFLSADFHKKAIEIEELQTNQKLNYEKIRNMYEKALEITQRGIKEVAIKTNGNLIKTPKPKGLGRKAYGLWFGYVEFERRVGNLDRANVIYRRATETLKDPKSFILMCQTKE